MSRKTALAAAITVMLYTRPQLVRGENIRLTPVQCGPFNAHYAIFDEEEAAERLESRLWVDHPNGLTALDEAIAEAAEKEAKQDAKDEEEELARRLKETQDLEATEKPPEKAATDSEPETAPKAAEVDKEPENAAEATESTQEADEAEAVNEDAPKADAPKDGEKVDGAKVDTSKKAKK